MGRSMVGTLAALLFLTTLWPTPVQAEDPRGVGIVTTLTGQATVTRAALPLQSSPLKFRDDLFYRDRISTMERSMARVLLGGKALITVRELSELTITEEPGRSSIVDLAIGKLSLAVVRSLMSPGETIEVRTHNAVVGVRGTVVVVEVTPSLATEVYVLKGSVEVFPSGMPTAAVIVNAFQGVTVTGNLVGQIRSFPALTVDQIVQDLKPTFQHTRTPDETKEAVKEKEQARALTHAKNFTATLPASIGTQELDLTKEAKEAQQATVAKRAQGNDPPGNAFGRNGTQPGQGNGPLGNAFGLTGMQPGQQGNGPPGNAFGLTDTQPGQTGNSASNGNSAANSASNANSAANNSANNNNKKTK